MRTSVVWTFCAGFAAIIMTTALSAPSHAQDPGECPVRLTGGEPVEAGDLFLVHASDECPPQVEAPAPTLPQVIVAPPVVEPAPTPIIVPPTPPTLKGLGGLAPPTTPPVTLKSTPSFVTPALTPQPSIATVPSAPQRVVPVGTPLVQPTTTPPLAPLVTADSAQIQAFVTALARGDELRLPELVFADGSSQLSAASEQTLAALAQAIESVGGSFVVNGYASNEGDDSTNEQLSWTRARLVGEALARQGVAGERLFVLGQGVSTRFGSNPGDNRRVTVGRHTQAL